MKNAELKQRIVAAAIAKQESVITDFKKRVKDLMANDGNVNEEEYDNQQQAFKAESMAEVNLLNEELEFAKNELDELRKIEVNKDGDNNTVRYGSVIRTDQKTFFVSASIEEFFVDELPIFGLSINTPLYKSMKGKKVGDSFAYGKYSYKIEEIL